MMARARPRAQVVERAARVLEDEESAAVRGDARGALARFSDYRALGRRLFDPDKRRRAEGRALGSLGRAHAKLGQHSEAVGALEAAIAVSRELGDRTSEALRLNCLGDAHAGGGQHDIAITCYARARALSAARGRQLESALDAARAALETREREATALETKLYAMRGSGGGLADPRPATRTRSCATREPQREKRAASTRASRKGGARRPERRGRRDRRPRQRLQSPRPARQSCRETCDALKICKELGDREARVQRATSAGPAASDNSTTRSCSAGGARDQPRARRPRGRGQPAEPARRRATVPGDTRMPSRVIGRR